jgi:hypothetical protein
VNADPVSLASRRLRTEYHDYRRGSAFAAEALLNSLCRAAWKATAAEAADAKLIPMTLALVFCDAASRIEGRPIDVGDAERWFGLMDQPIIRALDILTGDSRESPETALSDLALAYVQVRAEISN